MTIEQKAKAYDKAIDKIKYVMEHGVQPVLNKEDLQDIFSELKESEDDRIRKELLEYVKHCVCERDVCKEERDKWIAWLEKQGENIPVLSNSSNIGKNLQIDGFDAELNALLKKYEHLPKDEVIECLKFYTGVIINGKNKPFDYENTDIQQKDFAPKPNWSEEDDRNLRDIISAVHCVPYQTTEDEEIRANWLKSLKKRMEE